MKLKLILMLSTVFLTLSFLFIIRYIHQLEYSASDMIDINDQYKKIESDRMVLTLPEIEEKYRCKIIIRGEESYTNQLYQAIKRSDVMLDYMEGDKLIGKIIFTDNSNSFEKLKRNIVIALSIVLVTFLFIIYVIGMNIHRRILLPFHRLERFASNISMGDLEVPLAMDRTNYFGAFTESFDLMREELKRARLGEYEANISKKELVAQLSHDIKTPVSTIKALCELLGVKVKEEDIINKIKTINQKADVIDELISNMFHATLEELEVLKIEPKEELTTILPDMFLDLNHYGKIHVQNELPGCLIYCDRLRLNQVIDNIVNNSYKYAGTDIEVAFHEREHFIEIEIRDFGNTLSPTNMPLIFEKYYRGENASNQSGSGLGLYLAKLFMEGMKGEIECKLEGGFVVKLNIKKA